jgi:hypothetical protein
MATNAVLRFQRFLLYVAGLLCVLFSFTPIYLPGTENLIVMLGFVFVFYFAYHTPYFLPIWYLLLIGIMQDTLLGLPLGLHAFIFLVSHSLVRAIALHLPKGGFLYIWQLFMGTLGLALCLQWVLIGVSHGYYASLHSVFWQWLIMVLCYPPIYIILRQLHKLTSSGHVK